jgi:hypothetical protein
MEKKYMAIVRTDEPYYERFTFGYESEFDEYYPKYEHSLFSIAEILLDHGDIAGVRIGGVGWAFPKGNELSWSAFEDWLAKDNFAPLNEIVSDNYRFVEFKAMQDMYLKQNDMVVRKYYE